ncbi:MAG: hypothetical protein KatS3mg025_0341 [Bacteroidia bacterium]|nr:MAG: hypothetical protein KatS3mg025_0341 [Bacteroidia bacterium]
MWISGKAALPPRTLPKIEQKFLELARTPEYFVRKKVSQEEALLFFAHNPYKKELIQELPPEEIIFYESGNFVDLCKGAAFVALRAYPSGESALLGWGLLARR